MSKIKSHNNFNIIILKYIPQKKTFTRRKILVTKAISNPKSSKTQFCDEKKN